MDSSSGDPGTLLVDAHVHLHDCFAVDEFLDSAAENIQIGARQANVDESPLGVLLFTDPAGSDSIARLRGARQTDSLNGWTIGDTEEDFSLIARRRGDPKLFLIAGRQIATSDGLEVLALASPCTVPDGLALGETIEGTRECGAIAVVPWGFGKWWFGRGRLLELIMDGTDPHDLFLGDNSGRPRFSPTPPLFRRARAEGMRVLPGSDPLPFPDQVGKVGSYGLVMNERLDGARPAASVREILAQMGHQPDRYGDLEGILRFIRNQLAMQLHKRRPTRPRDSTTHR